MIIVSGRIYCRPGARRQFLADSVAVMNAARGAKGCSDFVIANDPIEADRVNVYEEWDTPEDLGAFRGDGPSSDMTAEIIRFEVLRHTIASSGPA